MPDISSESAVIRPENWTDPLPIDRFYSDRRPFEVDVGCGKGRFLAARAAAFPDRNFLGIDRSMSRIRKTEKKVLRQKLSHVRLLCLESSYVIRYLLPPGSVSVFYIFFPDPWPKRRHHRRRMFSESLLDSLWKTLLPDGQIHLATDHADYFDHIVRLFRAHPGFREIPTLVLPDEQRTDFEVLFLSKDMSINRRSYARQPSPHHPVHSLLLRQEKPVRHCLHAY